MSFQMKRKWRGDVVEMLKKRYRICRDLRQQVMQAFDGLTPRLTQAARDQARAASTQTMRLD
jgi:hypothetical protein